MYADDTVLFASDSDPILMLSRLQNSFNLITSWCNINLLTINESKTKYCIFNDNSQNPYIMKCNGQSLGNVASYKYLGVDITSDLNMDEYVSNVYKKASIKIYMLSKIRRYITTHAATLIYKQTILPYLDYASFVMDSAHQYSLALIDKVQKRGIRLIEYEKDYTKREKIKTLMLEYGIGNLKQRRDNQLLSFMYNESRRIENLNCKMDGMALRSDSKIKFREKLTRKTTVQKSPYYRGIALWNTLTPLLQKENTLLKFKRKLKITFPNRYAQIIHTRKARRKDTT